MDVYQKVLTKLMELTGGKETVDVDLAELLKKEGFFPSIDSIRDYMSSESWITETSRRNVIRITHWGVAAAKKVNTSGSEKERALAKEAANLNSKSRELLVLVEEFSSAPAEDKLKQIEKRMGDLVSSIQNIKANM